MMGLQTKQKVSGSIKVAQSAAAAAITLMQAGVPTLDEGIETLTYSLVQPEGVIGVALSALDNIQCCLLMLECIRCIRLRSSKYERCVNLSLCSLRQSALRRSFKSGSWFDFWSAQPFSTPHARILAQYFARETLPLVFI